MAFNPVFCNYSGLNVLALTILTPPIPAVKSVLCKRHINLVIKPICFCDNSVITQE